MSGQTQPLKEVLEERKLAIEIRKLEAEAQTAEVGPGRTEYMLERKALIDLERDYLKSYEQALLTLSAGALGLSITFVQQIAPHPHDTNWLFAAWICFGLAVLSMLLSFLASKEGIRKYWANLDAEQTTGPPMTQTPANVSGTASNKWATVAVRLNWVGLGAFMAGIGALAAFAGLNLH